MAWRYFEDAHWLLDSQNEPEFLSPGQYRLYAKKHRDAYPIFRVKGEDGGDSLLGPETCSTAVGTDTLASAGSSAPDTPPPTKPGSQLSPRVHGEEVLPADAGEVAKRRRLDVDYDVTVLDLTYHDECVAPTLAVAQQIGADDAQQMICEARRSLCLTALMQRP